jgi:hypothetical protein
LQVLSLLRLASFVVHNFHNQKECCGQCETYFAVWRPKIYLAEVDYTVALLEE